MIKYDIQDGLFGCIDEHSKYNILSEDKQSNDRIYNLDVEFKEFNDKPIDTGIKFINGDRYTSIIKAKMLMETKLIDLQGITVSMNLKEGDNDLDVYTIICDDVYLDQSVVSVNLEPYVVDMIGTNTFEFVLTKGDKVLTSQRYSYEVKDSIGEGYIGEVEEETALQKLIQKTQNLINQLPIDVTENDIKEIISMIK